MKTKAWVLVDYNKLEVWDIELPKLQSNQLLVEIHYTSICGSQINEITGKKGEDKYLPHLLGHEAVGIVRETGPSLGHADLCDKTVICTWIGGISPQQGPKIKGVNAGPITTFSKYSIIDISRLIHIDKKPSPELALFGCTVPTGMGSFNNYVISKRMRHGVPLGILGLGGVGIAAALWAKHYDLRVTGYDPNTFKQEFAESLGVEKWQNWGGKYDYILECSGAKESMENGFRSLHDKGTLLLAGNAPEGTKIEVDPFDFIKGKLIIGIVGGNSKQNQIAQWADKAHYFKPMITKEYPFEQLDQAAYDLKTGQIIKPIIKCL